MSKEAMTLALEALAVKFSEGWHEGIKIDASDIMLLNDAAQALAEQPAQQEEPFAMKTHGAWDGLELLDDMPDGACLYTSPQRTWVGLTDEEKSDLWCESTGRDCVNEDTHVFADAIEAKLREKNA